MAALATTAGRSGETVRVLSALVRANARFWPSIAPQVRAQAEAIDDAELRELALAKLRAEGLNAQAAAIAATLAPRPHRAHAVRAIVALELLFDYLDGLTERPLADPVADGERLYEVFVWAVQPAAGGNGRPAGDSDEGFSRGERRGERPAADSYALSLATVVRSGLARLPARDAIAAVACDCARRATRTQARMHALADDGHEPLAGWGRDQARNSPLGWREHLAGSAASVLTLHALIAAAADPGTSSEDAWRIDAAYLRLCALATLLDGIVDREEDRAAGRLSYVSLYEDETVLAAALATLAREGADECAKLRNGGHHLLTLAALLAYWSTVPGARRALSSPAYAALRIELGHLVFAPTVVMRAWRMGRQIA
jgi:tetraprenyl-beta-curcumene synthase